MANSIEIVPRWFTVELPVFPPIPMVQRGALALASSLGAKLSLTDIHMSDETWEYRQPAATERQPYGQIRVTVEESQIRIEHRYPATGLEQFERLIQTVVEALEPAKITPQMTFINVELDYVVDLKQDSRLALLIGLNLLEEDEESQDRIDTFDRPCHSVGLRLGFPAYIMKPEEGAEDDDTKETPPAEGGDESAVPNHSGADWQALVTLETLVDDPRKASVQITGQWVEPCQWDGIHEIIIQRLNVAEKFLRDKTLPFLGHFTAEEDDD